MKNIIGQSENRTFGEDGQRRLPSTIKYLIAVCLVSVIFSTAAALYAEATIGWAYYLYNLSNFNGAIPYNWAKLSADQERNEVYVIYQNDIEIFNDRGMRIYNFGADTGINGVIRDLAVDKEGEIYVLTHENDTYEVIRCNYRGEPVSKIEFKNFPSRYSKFLPGRIVYREGLFYLADLLYTRTVIITDAEGRFKAGYDMHSILALDSFDIIPGQTKEIVGFDVDREGYMLFTVPTVFKAFRVSPDRDVKAFGDPGSIPGKFAVIAGISSDEKGNLYVVDTLKCVVIVFDKDYSFIAEFGLRGTRPGDLIAPNNMIINNGNVYVSQARNRGVSVYRITQN